MKRSLPILIALGAIGCSGGDSAPKADTGAPEVKYQMVPATTGGTGGTAAPPAATPPAAAPSNPKSSGSD